MDQINLSYLFSHALLFLFKIFVLLLFTIVFMFMLNIFLGGSRKRQNTNISITDISEKFNNMQNIINRSILSKRDYKLYKKKEKEDRKLYLENTKQKKKIFFINFKGDVKVSKIDELRTCVTALLKIAEKKDEVAILIESPGGLVSNYGLAASQLERIVKAGIKLTVLVDLVAASGGYLMACVANKIIASPFSIVGSIGVVAQLPNINRLLEKYNIDIEQHTSGKYKRTLTTLGKNNQKGREKFVEDLKRTHELFKSFVKKYRPAINIEEVSTGEYWYALQAIEHKLVDEIKTSDEFLYENSKKYKIYEIKVITKQSIKNKFKLYVHDTIYNIYYRTIGKII